LQAASLQHDLADLRKQVEAIERKGSTMPTAPLVARAQLQEEFYERPPSLVERSRARFPALISEVLAQSTSTTVRVKADTVDHDVFVPANDGAFYLVNDGTAGLCVIPAHEPMTTQLYKTYYKSSYDCSVQGAGDIYVVEPATVSPRGEMWRLASRGKLEVRGS
ncbi:MAG TPA: hypothetical protein VE010_05045, partial [Thermoanaerobaculia bacterium]|nr:hypothetical protein [Thermoanaerobaculia bacterium]